MRSVVSAGNRSTKASALNRIDDSLSITPLGTPEVPEVKSRAPILSAGGPSDGEEGLSDGGIPS